MTQEPLHHDFQLTADAGEQALSFHFLPGTRHTCIDWFNKYLLNTKALLCYPKARTSFLFPSPALEYPRTLAEDGLQSHSGIWPGRRGWQVLLNNMASCSCLLPNPDFSSCLSPRPLSSNLFPPAPFPTPAWIPWMKCLDSALPDLGSLHD